MNANLRHSALFQRAVAGTLALALTLLAACTLTGDDPNAEASDTPGSSMTTQVSIGDVRWYVDYDEGLAAARAQNKALWVHFGENPG